MPEVAPGDWRLHFPKAGLDRSAPFGHPPNRDVGEGQYARTTHLGVNVRAFEQGGRRRRGGSRSGMSKYLPTKPGGLTWVTQHLGVVVSSGSTGPGGVAVQESNSGRVVTVVAVAQGNVYTTVPEGTVWTAAVNNSGETPPLNATGLVYSTTLNQKMYFADGTNYRVYDPKTNIISTWTPTAGSLPIDGRFNRARLINTWRGRIALSGVEDDPHNWFLSRVGDALDFNYGSGANDSAQAVSGNNSPMGKIGDVVTAIVSFSDDVCVWGGDSSIYRMQGDPFFGGQIDKVTDRVGMAWGLPYTIDPKGRLFFFSSTGGVYGMDPTSSSAPVRISQAVEQLVQDVNTGTHNIIMEWDDTFQELHIWVTRLAAPASAATHFCWEERTKAWWLDRYANHSLNPLCSCVVDGNRPEDRCIVVGGWDGYVRKLDPTATTDDGTAIASEVLVGPLRTPNLDDLVVDQSQAIMGEDSGAVTMDFLAGKTAEAALASTPKRVGVLAAGRNPTHAKRVAGHAVYARLTSNAAWAMEELRLRVLTKGRTRRRVS